MGFFGKKKTPSDQDAIWLYVQCDKCGEKLRIRVDRRYDLEPDPEGGYFLRKEMMDGRCFRLMYSEIHFDRAYNILSQELSGGHFITKEEFEAQG